MTGNVGGGGGGRGGNGGGGGPVSTKKMLHNIKEILGGGNACSEDEIYAMLKECNMDPSETVHRLLNQDTFHEVKSKREKKKEIKENTDLRSRGVNNNSNRGGRGGADRAGLAGTNRVSSSEYGGNRGKPISKKENGSSSLILGSGISGNSVIKSSTPLSDYVSMGNTAHVTPKADVISSQPSTEFQQAWLGVPGQVTLADIVRMGRTPVKASRAPTTMSELCASHNAIASNNLHSSAKHSMSIKLPSESLHEVHSSQDPVSEVPELVHESGVAVGQHISHDEWSLSDNPPGGSSSSVLEIPDASDVYADPSASLNFNDAEVNLHQNSRLDEIGGVEGNVDGETLAEDSIRSMTASYEQTQLNDSGGEHGLDDGSHKNMNYQSQVHTFEHCEVDNANMEVSTAVAGLQQLSLHEGILGVTPPDDNPAVIIPNHLQVTNADCSHLSFGSFGSGIGATISGSFASKPLENNSEVASISADATSAEHSDARNPEYYSNEQLRSISNVNEASRMSTSSGNYDTVSSSSQLDVLRDDNTDVTHGLQFSFPSSMPGYTTSNTTQPSAASPSYAQGNSQMQNLAPLSSVMQAYSSSLPSNLLASNVQPGREFDLPYSPLLATQSMPTKYSTAMSSISGPTISMPEALKPGAFSMLQPTPQNLTTTSMAMAPTISPNLPVHAYSQPTLPLGHFANVITYPFLPQSYTYMPSAAFQQTYTGNSAYQQSPAAVHTAGIKYTLPQYKNNVALSSLLQSAVVPPGYGGFGSSTNIPGNYPLNPSTASAGSVIGRDDILSSQYKEGNHYPDHQQSESSAMWIHGDGSRTMSALPSSTYYSFQAQNQNSGFRQGHQPSHYGPMGYPNLYHSQAGVSQEHHQNPSDANLNNSQAPTAQTSHQMWQHSY